MALPDREDELLRSVALKTAQTVLAARERAERELIDTAEALRRNEARLRAIFNQAAVGIAIAALDGRFLEMNGKFCAILGHAPEQLIGRTFGDITHPDDLAETHRRIAALLDGDGSDFAVEKRYLRPDGSIVWSLTNVTLQRDDRGKPEQFIAIIEDITSRKDAEAALREESRVLEMLTAERNVLLESERAARTEAERMSNVKDAFLATLSHELRTPLNAILGWSQILKAGRDQADIMRGLDVIERNARMQTQLIEDLLDMSRITSGKIRLDVQPIDPAVVIQAAVETLAPAADAKGVRVETLLDPAAGPIAGDPGRLQQIVWNLLSNAIKFTPRGGRIQLLLQRAGSYAEIHVADTGVGIEPEFIPHLFERFRQGDASTTRKYGGLGLGLSIVKTLVELHGGTVQVTSPGTKRGTTVTVTLPLTAVHHRGPGAEVSPADPRLASMPSRELFGSYILVVDDQKDARELIARVLQDAGAEVTEVCSADEAIAAIEARCPDMLISDIGMPDVDGFELIRRVRALDAECGGRIPAIALTAFTRSEDRTRALRAGFTLHVSKPVDPAELLATVASVAGRLGG